MRPFPRGSFHLSGCDQGWKQREDYEKRRGDAGTGGRGDGGTRRRGGLRAFEIGSTGLCLYLVHLPPHFTSPSRIPISPRPRVSPSPCLPVSPSPRPRIPASPRPRVSPSPRTRVSPSPRQSPIRPDWFAFFHKGLDAFIRVIGFHQFVKVEVLDHVQRLINRHSTPNINPSSGEFESPG